MNFEQIRQAEGKKDGQYQMKVSMFGMPTEMGGPEFNPKSGKPLRQVTIRDDKGETNKVKIFGDKMNEGCIGHRLAFDIAPYTSDKNNQTYYSGLWNDRANVSQNAQQAPSQPTQRSNVATGLPQHPSPTQEDTPETRDIRKCAIKAAVRLAASEQIPIDQVIKFAEGYVEYIYKGLHSPNQLPRGQETDINAYEEAKAAHESDNFVPDSDIPF